MIKIIKSNFYNQNIYLMTNEEKNTIIIDPGNNAQEVLEYIDNNNLTPTSVFITHGHFDHFSGLKKILKKFKNLKIYIGNDDVNNLFDEDLNLSFLANIKAAINYDEFHNSVTGLIEKDYSIDGFEINITEIPGHTNGSIALFFPKLNYLFTGDTLLKESIGRVDLKHSVPEKYKDSLLKFKKFKNNVIIYPGHGPKTNIKHEMLFNDFLLNWIK